MNYRQLGNTDIQISEIGIGCSGFWGDRKFSERKAAAVIYAALDRGVNFFDTGHNYSGFNAEPRLGRILKNILSSVDRSQLIISSKAGTTIGSAPIIPWRKVRTQNYSPDYIEQSCVESIRNLNCDYLDVFQLHGISQLQITPGLLDRLASMKERGMFRCLGINTHTYRDIEYVSRNPDIFDMILLDYNVLQLDREPIIRTLREVGIGVVAGTILAQGHLVGGKVGSIRSVADIWYLARALLKPAGRRFAKNSVGMREALSVSEYTNARTAFAYVLENLDVSSFVFGTTNVSNLHEVVDAVDLRLDRGTRCVIEAAYDTLQERVSC